MEWLSNYKLKILQTDNGGKYISREFSSFLKVEGSSRLDDDDNPVPGRGGGWIKPATAIAICVISYWKSLDNLAEEDVSTVGADVMG